MCGVSSEPCHETHSDIKKYLYKSGHLKSLPALASVHRPGNGSIYRLTFGRATTGKHLAKKKNKHMYKHKVADWVTFSVKMCRGEIAGKQI